MQLLLLTLNMTMPSTSSFLLSRLLCCACLCSCRSVLICHHVLLVATNWFRWHCTVVLQQQCN